MNDNIIQVIEEDVDGCGSCAEVYVQLEEAPPANFASLFAAAIDEAKDCADDDWDTDSIVEDALDILNRRGICKGEIVSQPFCMTITF